MSADAPCRPSARATPRNIRVHPALSAVKTGFFRPRFPLQGARPFQAPSPFTFTRLPRRLDGALSRSLPKRPFHRDFLGQCTLPNGSRVRVRLDEDNKQATGFGGADPSAYVTVWVGRRMLLSHSMVYAGHGTENPWIAALLISRSRLAFCFRSDNEVQEPLMPVNCTDEPPTFANLPIKVRP